MPILVEVNASKEVIWKDTAGVVWRGRSSVVWKDQEGAKTLYLSLEHVELEHFYKGLIESFSSPQYSTASEHGGYVELIFGTIVFSPDAFSSDWPPPKYYNISIDFTNSTVAAAVPIFFGEIYLASFDENRITYNIKAPKYTQRLLTEGSDYDGNTVPYPKAIGIVTHVSPLRVANNAGRPCYHLAGLGTAAFAISVLSFTSAAAGAKTKVTLASAHGWGNGTRIMINGTVNFSSISYLIESVAGATFVIPVTYPTDNSEVLPLHANALEIDSFGVYDDGVPIQENVVIIGDGTFALSASPVGEVTMSGSATAPMLTDLEEVVTWAQGRLSGVGSTDFTPARATSPVVSRWLTSQMPLIDFLSEICKFFTHYFYIKGNIITLGDMLLDNSSETLTEHAYFRAGYSVRNARSQIKASWVTREAVNGFVDEVRTARYIKDIPNTVVESLYTVSSGTTDGTATGQLVNSGAAFVSGDGVKIGMVARNTADDTFSIVTATSETILELEDDIFVSGEDYVVGPSFVQEQELSIEPYHTTKNNVSIALQNILSVLSKDVAEISIPISDSLPVPGKKLTFPDTMLVVDTITWIRARDLIYDFDNDTVIITGEGVIT